MIYWEKKNKFLDSSPDACLWKKLYHDLVQASSVGLGYKIYYGDLQWFNYLGLGVLDLAYK